jgi:O-acetylhomoserine/O-acetylserine sulfhydrylase-like pyridoxal-dependent enzyme
MFTKENTYGFTVNQLDRMNKNLDIEMLFVSIDDPEYEEKLQQASELILKKWL